jgi:hypothetical protein
MRVGLGVGAFVTGMLARQFFFPIQNKTETQNEVN